MESVILFLRRELCEQNRHNPFLIPQVIQLNWKSPVISQMVCLVVHWEVAHLSGMHVSGTLLKSIKL